MSWSDPLIMHLSDLVGPALFTVLENELQDSISEVKLITVG